MAGFRNGYAVLGCLVAIVVTAVYLLQKKETQIFSNESVTDDFAATSANELGLISSLVRFKDEEGEYLLEALRKLLKTTQNKDIADFPEDGCTSPDTCLRLAHARLSRLMYSANGLPYAGMWTRGTVDRVHLDQWLQSVKPNVTGRCVEWGAAYMKQHFQDECVEKDEIYYEKRAEQYRHIKNRWHVDIHHMDMLIPENTFDTIVCTQVFEHVQNPFIAIQQIYRVLKPGGVLLFTVPFFCKYHAIPRDFFRYTHEGAQTLLESAGFQVHTVSPYGDLNVLVGVLQGLGPKDFTEAELNHHHQDWALTIMVLATKPLV
mmetsp:Transcript_19126/g.31293  ORF Transcript_19126/g.31293 Transcript_19126/m.31293 type:complete len:318 (-) Transcript_19126:217-1170(-)|eukprot:CAMPEP_0184644452 /NCGR_PEP_ID=MMETSP0308-20130426/1176_1 /TAXON_ID=38269 /ORGANISM="Gloeochaete witrockiana, Strain SAG 46.84" /LENGTH=317 /DNA_ID=CAMNT_0027072999 /DNA_START=139 /DNA_END=1092 /DNA_ORIENTATION=+